MVPLTIALSLDVGLAYAILAQFWLSVACGVALAVFFTYLYAQT
jgi:uncharacterized protein (DUF58 family)